MQLKRRKQPRHDAASRADRIARARGRAERRGGVHQRRGTERVARGGRRGHEVAEVACESARRSVWCVPAPPVASRQSVSEIHAGKPDTLSKASTWLLLAAMDKSRSSRGNARKGAVLGRAAPVGSPKRSTWPISARPSAQSPDRAAIAQDRERPGDHQHEIGVRLHVEEFRPIRPYPGSAAASCRRRGGIAPAGCRSPASRGCRSPLLAKYPRRGRDRGGHRARPHEYGRDVPAR
jgi:hypothetical protein